MKNNKKNGDLTFYSARGITLLLVVITVFAILALGGMYALGVISMPSFITNIFNPPENTVLVAPDANISPEVSNFEYMEAISREEYADALASISIPSKFYQNYEITRYHGELSATVEYTAIYDGGNWWVQTKEGDVIISTVVCKDGKIKLSDNTDNTSVFVPASDISFTEHCGYLPIKNLTDIIHKLTNGQTVEYAGGISDYSLSFTPSRGTSENIFTFFFRRKDGISEEYTFAFESATILSAVKYNKDGERIYRMEMKNSRNNLDDVDVASLIKIN